MTATRVPTLFGAYPTLDTHRRSFADTLIRYLAEHGEGRPLQFLADDFSLKLGEDRIWLEPRFVSFTIAREPERAGILGEIFRETRPLVATPAWHEIASQALPILRSRIQQANRRLLLQANGIAPPQEVTMRLVDDLAIGVVVPHGEAVRSLTAADLTQMGVSFDHALATATANLSADTTAAWRTAAANVHELTGTAAASRLLLPGAFDAISGGKPLIVLAAATDILLAAPTADVQAVKRLLSRGAEILLEHSNGLAPRLLKHDAGQWSIIEALAPSHPAAATLIELQKHWLANAYNQQKEALQALPAEPGNDAFIAECAAAHAPDGSTITYAGVIEGTPLTWLPKVNQVVFIPANPRAEPVIADWKVVEKVCGAFVAVPALEELPRVAMRYPTAEQIRRIGNS